jgi:hypothetical protein
VRLRVVLELDSGRLLQEARLTEAEMEGIDPWEYGARDDVMHTLLTESKVLATDDW